MNVWFGRRNSKVDRISDEGLQLQGRNMATTTTGTRRKWEASLTDRFGILLKNAFRGGIGLHGLLRPY